MDADRVFSFNMAGEGSTQQKSKTRKKPLERRGMLTQYLTSLPE